jgi:hypothetical protein
LIYLQTLEKDKSTAITYLNFNFIIKILSHFKYIPIFCVNLIVNRLLLQHTAFLKIKCMKLPKELYNGIIIWIGISIYFINEGFGPCGFILSQS